MSKIKLSFSLLIAFFLVGILSTAAFAKDPYGLKPTQVQGTLNLLVNFTGNTAAGDTDATKFDLHVYDSQGVEVGTPFTNLAISSNKGSQTISGLTPGLVYTIKLFHAGDDTATVTALSTTTGLITDPHNGTLLNQSNSPKTGEDTTVTLDKNGNGLQNANQTGFNNTRKNRSGQKVHGFYQNNTNSCASCHQTHTAANGESLLFKDGVYSTCSACHDGTTGAYNSFAPVAASQTASISGTFNVKADGHNGSLHEADGSLQISAAPGGNHTPGAKTPYSQEFDCASCHAAHGSGSAGENNLNLDPMGWASIAYGTTTNDAKNGKLFNNIQIVDTPAGATIPTTMSTPFILVKTTATTNDVNNADPTKNNFWWKRANVQVGDLVIQTYKWNNTKYVADYSLWLRELGYPYKANTLLKDASGNSLTMDQNLKIVWRDGFAFGSSVANIASANVSLGIDVETTDNIATLFDSTSTGYVPDSGTEMSKYCSACHVDYLSTTRTDNTGVYSQAHRHATNQDRLTCVRCHYAHGSEAQIMKDANDNTYYTLTAPGKIFDATVTGNTDKAISYFVDPNPTSALKRYTGMSVCYACHGKGEQFIGNPNTNAIDSTTKEFLKGGDPGSTRTDISK